MKTLTLNIDDSVSEKFIWLLQHFSPSEVSIMTDDAYLRSISGMVESIQMARNEPITQAVTLDQLNWKAIQ